MAETNGTGDRETNESDKSRRRQPNKRPTVSRRDLKYGLRMAAVAFGISIAMSLPTQTLVSRLGLISAALVILLVVAIGVCFDVVGVATAAASPVPYHARAAKKMPGAKQALWMIRNAEKVNNFCTDVVGDIINTLSGAATGTIVARLAALADLRRLTVEIIIISVVAAITVGGKAAAKGLAIRHSQEVVSWAANILSRLHLLPAGKDQRRRRVSGTRAPRVSGNRAPSRSRRHPKATGQR